MRAKYLQYLKMDTRKIFDQKRGEICIIYHLLQLHGSFLSCSESGCNRFLNKKVGRKIHGHGIRWFL